MAKDLNKIFEELLARYIKVVEKKYKQLYEKSRDKEFIIEELTWETKLLLRLKGGEVGNLVDFFQTRYKRGEDVNQIFSEIRKVYGEKNEITDVAFYRKIDGKRVKTPSYENEERNAIKSLATDDKRLIKLLIIRMTYAEILKRLPTLFTEENPAVNNIKSVKNVINIKWTGSKDNKNEFVQLVYGLHKSGLINSGQGEITKIVESLAEVFNVDLGHSWQSNLSSSIHKNKLGYNPPVFNKIKTAYEQYAIDLTENKKKNH